MGLDSGVPSRLLLKYFIIFCLIVIQWLLSRELNTFMQSLAQHMIPQMRQKQEDHRLADTETEKISVSGQMELQGKSVTVVKI